MAHRQSLLRGQRRLAAIMFTDMVGYTALGQRNESLSLALVEEQRKRIRPILRKHSGREVKTMGDAFLVEFHSALDAVRCAYEIQRVMKEYNISQPEETRLHLRIGIHVGDVVESKGDISGDTVNVASRIEPMAEDGGVCLSRQVYDHVHNKFELPMISLGVKTLKNLSMPMEIFKIVPPWEEEKADESYHLDRKRIAILPFANMSPDSNDEYFADGITEELIATISRIREVSVVSRTSMMQYRKNPKPIPVVAKELQAGTILEGSVRKAGNKVRVTVQMVDGARDKQEWSESYDRGLEDIFAIQSDISQNVAEVLRVQLLADEKQRLENIPTRNVDAYTMFLKGRRHLNERTQRDFQKATHYFEEAVKRDPRYASAYSGLSDCYHLLEYWGFLRPRIAWPKAMEYAEKAVEMDNTLAEAHTSLAIGLSYFKRDWKRSEEEYERALDLNPNYATAHFWYSSHLLQPERRWDEAIREVKEAEKLDPLSPVIATYVGVVQFYAGHRQEAVNQFRRVLKRSPEFAFAHAKLGSALVSMSSVKEGTAEIEKALDLSPEVIWSKADLAYAYMAAGRREDAESLVRELQEISRERYIPGTVIAMVYSVLGEKDLAFESLSNAVEDGTSTFAARADDPVFDTLRTDPRFNKILEKVGLA